MTLVTIDWVIIGLFFSLSVVIGLMVSKKSGESSTEFFAAGKGMPWWLLGISMVATTFSTDTPNVVTQMVRENGVAGNWVWWSFLLTGMLTVFVYARLWSRSKVLTDVAFYEIRYSGASAAFLRGFRAIYLGGIINIIIMASVTLAAIKICRILFNFDPIFTVVISGMVTVTYSAFGGLRSVLLTDVFQFILAMIGAIGAVYYALGRPEVGGLAGLLSNEALQAKLSFFPSFQNKDLLYSAFIMPLAVQWWSVWYPGAEPGGGGYIAQRMLAAKDENNAVGAVFLFNACHYALRPWPWILVALASIIVFPTLDSIKEAFPHATGVVDNDIAYPAMLTFLPAGLVGLVVASLAAAYMSTISTHLNWGSSYIVHDFYARFVRPDASEHEYVRVGRISTCVLMVLVGGVALCMESALNNFKIMLEVGAGTGLVFLLRWFWWRVNAASELTAMIVSFVVAMYFRFLHGHISQLKIESWEGITINVMITTLAWITVALLTKPSDHATLASFCRLVQPGGPGWKKVMDRMRANGEDMGEYSGRWPVPHGILCMMLGCLAIWTALFGTGYWIYGQWSYAAICTVGAILASIALAVAVSRTPVR